MKEASDSADGVVGVAVEGVAVGDDVDANGIKGLHIFILCKVIVLLLVLLILNDENNKSRILFFFFASSLSLFLESFGGKIQIQKNKKG